MMDVNALVDIVVPAMIQEGATQLGKGIMEKIQNLVSPWLEAAYARLFARYVQTPDEVTTTEKKDLNLQLARLLEQNLELAQQIEDILKSARQENISQTITQHGSGNQAIQIAGSHNQVSR